MRLYKKTWIKNSKKLFQFNRSFESGIAMWHVWFEKNHSRDITSFMIFWIKRIPTVLQFFVEKNFFFQTENRMRFSRHPRWAAVGTCRIRRSAVFAARAKKQTLRQTPSSFEHFMRTYRYDLIHPTPVISVMCVHTMWRVTVCNFGLGHTIIVFWKKRPRRRRARSTHVTDAAFI